MEMVKCLLRDGNNNNIGVNNDGWPKIIANPNFYSKLSR